MAGAYEAMRFLEIVLAGLQVATLTPRIYPSPFADRPRVITPARAGSKRKFMKVIQSSWIKRRCPSHARAHDHEFFQDAERPTKKCRDYWSAAPADGTLAAHCRPNGKFGTSVQKAALDK